MIQVTALSKRFGNRTAVNEVSFQARPGEIFGLLGENGAGKTTNACATTY
ncbi:MAG: ATP-binding cassette domain-containing protein [Selenomonadales bacterium]|jgi:ABC-2 type transport system ATP-binding protein|nr:ATP-binding cassette domain-containing protein [Selenomonadales bacterium]